MNFILPSRSIIFYSLLHFQPIWVSVKCFTIFNISYYLKNNFFSYIICNINWIYKAFNLNNWFCVIFRIKSYLSFSFLPIHLNYCNKRSVINNMLNYLRIIYCFSSMLISRSENISSWVLFIFFLIGWVISIS